MRRRNYFEERHGWDGCKCAKCGAVRDMFHKWNGYVCARCGARREAGHDWECIGMSQDIEAVDDGYFLPGFGSCGPVVERIRHRARYRCNICGRECTERFEETVERRTEQSRHAVVGSIEAIDGYANVLR